MAERDLIRIPNLPLGPMTDSNGNPTDDELTYRQSLNTNLQTLFGKEGVVVPTLTATQISTIESNTVTVGATSLPTTQYGTEIYQSSSTAAGTTPNDELVVAMNNGADPAAPVFKQAVLVDGTDATAGGIDSYIIVNIGGTLYKMALYALA